MVDALLLNHPADAQHVQSVNDTLHRALPSLQSGWTTDIGITMHFRCNCDEGVRNSERRVRCILRLSNATLIRSGT